MPEGRHSLCKSLTPGRGGVLAGRGGQNGEKSPRTGGDLEAKIRSKKGKKGGEKLCPESPERNTETEPVKGGINLELPGKSHAHLRVSTRPKGKW